MAMNVLPDTETDTDTDTVIGDCISEPLYLNVYDVTKLNGYMIWLGLGVYHSAVQAYGKEYAFGAHDYATSGVMEANPGTCPAFTFRKRILVGMIRMTHSEFMNMIAEMSSHYTGDSYCLITKNCNHFSADVCLKLTGCSIPAWVNRLARTGSFCHYLLPKRLKNNKVYYKSDYELSSENNKPQRYRYRGLNNALPSVATMRSNLLVSSVYLQSLFVEKAIPSDLSKSSVLEGQSRHLHSDNHIRSYVGKIT